MRHRVYGKHLGRNKDQRKNLFKGLMYALFSHGTIQTSETKAKAIKGLVDKVINFAKEKNIHDLQSHVSDKSLQERLVKEITPKLGVRTSGYTRLVKMGTRAGDQTTMVRMSIIGSEELKPLEKELKVKKQEPNKETKKPQVKTVVSKRLTQTKKTQVKRKAKKA
ncbi:MAG: 50S ribosomal protein L17 [Candidatus Daviesbacteria bacterium]|nr:50S ribosomal protein L17 [Candidatus Daviesbacteria bacterium]